MSYTEIELSNQKNQPMSLSQLFRHPEFLSIFRCTIGDATYLKIPNDACGLILTGLINHSNLTIDSLIVTLDADTSNFAFQATIPAATATGTYNIFGTEPNEKHTGWNPILLPPNSRIYMNGGFTYLTILTWKAK